MSRISDFDEKDSRAEAKFETMVAQRISRPTLLVSGVSENRSANPRETELTRRLVGRVLQVANDSWNVVVSWAEKDGVDGVLAHLDDADAVVVLGGPDIAPEHYQGTSPYPHEDSHYPVSDNAQLALVRTSIERDIPIMGICRGLQVMNVALGGSLIQHLDSGGHMNPRLLESFSFARHEVTFDSSVALGAALREASGSDRATIHSAHHQAIGTLADSLVVAARSDDGIIEAIQHRSAAAVAVQWHPEDPDADDTILRALLVYLGQGCCMCMSNSRMLAVA
ncbi:gamma-glutamyl-gamma-aminobutyrate hydrolase family protein [Actinomycetaceae bacterium WB03_NA08]|uniref:Gamma-glutamyl-gamma-aminobutyrate hydrolase family protein n=1 Tax=Scrofimicrobium canadense TaxID=2652290 RepID=A0A6N7W9U3_9ACTO|nr:gamma-glutamyl-gamma-aminobutyrate hydrolase family protein [Scrofimicrobium canadense]MSS85212.1 gamma-glutamyl-gamma-aminobutyrate hydrolase family protein [Scrofimicrobium canadense]